MVHWDIKPYKFNSRCHPQHHNDAILCYPCATIAGILHVILSTTICSASCGWWLLLIYCERKILLAGWWLLAGTDLV